MNNEMRECLIYMNDYVDYIDYKSVIENDLKEEDIKEYCVELGKLVSEKYIDLRTEKFILDTIKELEV